MPRYLFFCFFAALFSFVAFASGGALAQNHTLSEVCDLPPLKETEGNELPRTVRSEHDLQKKFFSKLSEFGLSPSNRDECIKLYFSFIKAEQKRDEEVVNE